MFTWKIPEDLALYNWSLDYRVPLAVSLIYSIVVAIISRRNQKLYGNLTLKKISPPQGKTHSSSSTATSSSSRPREPWTAFRLFVVAHNIFLMLFSATTFLVCFPILVKSFQTRSAYDAFCDKGDWAYQKALGFWTWLFYMSKYYELIDTFILLAKGKPSSFLQTYHHAGAIITMWMLSTTRAFGAWVFVCFNSFIHTFMYFYYALTCLGYQPKWKRLMTYMQITQFLVGLPIAVSYVFVPGCVPTDPHPKDQLAKLLGINGYWSHFASLAVSFSYVSYLVVLFFDFARRAYSVSHSKSKQN